MNASLSELSFAGSFNPALWALMPSQSSTDTVAAAKTVLLEAPQTAARVHADIDLATVLDLLYG